MVKCLTHGLCGFNGAGQRRLATLMVTMLILSCWQLSSEVELRRIFDVCKQWANSSSHEFVKKNMVRYKSPKRAICSLLVYKGSTHPRPRPRPRVHAAFLHLQCANCPFWPLVSKYTILTLLRPFGQYLYGFHARDRGYSIRLFSCWPNDNRSSSRSGTCDFAHFFQKHELAHWGTCRWWAWAHFHRWNLLFNVQVVSAL